MKRFLPLLISVLFASLFTISDVSATHLAAGEVSFEPSRRDSCTFEYAPILKFYRECSGVGAPSQMTLTVQSTCFGQLTFQCDPYSTATNGGGIEVSSNCLLGGDLPCTEEYWFRPNTPDGKITLPGPCSDWVMSWSVCCRPGNNVNVNGGSLYVQSLLNNTFVCDTVKTGPRDFPPNQTCFNNNANSSAVFNDNRPVVSFCVGKSYEYYMGATDVDGDRLEYDLFPALDAFATPVGYTGTYSVFDQIPSVIRPAEVDKVNGILKFTPAENFTGAFTYVVREFRDSCYLVDTTDADGNLRKLMKVKEVLVGETMRDTRFVFGDDCNDEIPQFGNVPDPGVNPAFDNDLEFDCAEQEFDIILNVDVQCNSIEPLGSDFRLVKGPVTNPTAIFAVDTAFAVTCNNNETNHIRVKLYKPIGPGQYNLFLKTGDDFNTLRTRCGIQLPEFLNLTVTINNNFSYELGDDISVCRPADPAPIVTAPIPFATNYIWFFDGDTIGGNDQSQAFDTLVDGQIGLLIDVEGCTYTDFINLDVVLNRPLEIPDYTICQTQRYEVIRVDSMQADFVEWSRLEGTNPEATRDWQIIGTADTLVPPTKGLYSVRVGLGLCTETDTFRINVIPFVDVQLGDDSLTFCNGEVRTLKNLVDYDDKNTETYTFQWYFNDNILPNDTTDELGIRFGSGEYKLEVARSNGCAGSDSVFVTIVDSLAPPVPTCVDISFRNGQLFAWNAIAGADSYEISYNGTDWQTANGADGLSHRTEPGRAGISIKQILVRAVNSEVDEFAPCKFSDIGRAVQCEIKILPPNVITPNGDGVNDFLIFDLIEAFPGTSLKLFNRWGRVVYESSDYLNDYNPDDLDEGVYFYVLDINDPEQPPQKGTITLLR